jgi:hypothetical protein
MMAQVAAAMAQFIHASRVVKQRKKVASAN